jgi:hypothetical protein
MFVQLRIKVYYCAEPKTGKIDVKDTVQDQIGYEFRAGRQVFVCPRGLVRKESKITGNTAIVEETVPTPVVEYPHTERGGPAKRRMIARSLSSKTKNRVASRTQSEVARRHKKRGIVLKRNEVNNEIA